MTTKRLTETAQILADLVEKRADELNPCLESLTFTLAGREAVDFIDEVDRAQDVLAERWGNGEPKPEGWHEDWVDVAGATVILARFFLWWGAGLDEKGSK